MSNNPSRLQTPGAESYRAAYFEQLYGQDPHQTLIDRLRDGMIRALVRRYYSSGSLLEIGCGYGYLLGQFGQRWRLHGTDISAHAAAVAQRRLPHAVVVAADVQTGLPFAGQFDVVLAVNVIEHLSDPASAARHLAAALRAGGLLVVHLPTINNGLNRLIYRYTYERDPTHVYRPSGGTLDALLQQVGFEAIDRLYCPFWPAPLWRLLKPHPAYLATYVRR